MYTTIVSLMLTDMQVKNSGMAVCVPVILVLRKLRGDHEFEASLAYIARPYLKNINK